MLDLIGKVLSGRYRVEEYIDQGGMSYVYKAWNLLDEKYVALKVLKPELLVDKEFSERFYIEAMAASKVKHSNIVSLLDVGIEGNIKYLCFEFVQGQTIKQILKTNGAFDESRACQILVQVLQALQHAHSKNIIHRDIKPENIVIDSTGKVKILDFGIARIENTDTLTKKDMGVGTLQYSSPEQMLGKNITSASDIYSLGVVFYEMLTARLPFEGPQYFNRLKEDVLIRPRVLNPRISMAVENIILCALQANTNNRYTSAQMMLDDICSAMKDEEPIIANQFLQSIKLKEQQPVHKNIAPRKRENKVRQKSIRIAKTSIKKHYNVFLWSIPIFLIIIGIILYWGMNLITKVTQTVYAPDLIGLGHTKAIENARDVGLNPLIKYVYHDTIDENTVIKQVPSEQTPMHRGDTILIEVSQGREDDVVPNLANMSLKEAYNIASQRNFTLSVVERIASKEIEEGIILEQLVKPQEPIPQNRIVQVKVSGGLVYVPNFANLTLEEAIQRCHDLELTLESVEYSDIDDPKMLGRVLKQTPSVGNAVILGTNIRLVVGSAHREYKGELAIDTTGFELNTEIKVVLVEGKNESIQYVGSYKPDGDSQMIIPIQSNFSKNIKANIYINGELKESREVQLR